MTPTLMAQLAQQHGLFTAAQVRSAGITDDERRHKVRRGEWIRVRRGVYIDAETRRALSTLVDRHRIEVAAAQLVVGRPSWASGHSAFFIHNALPSFPKMPIPDLTCRSGQTHRSPTLNVRVWPLTDDDVTTMNEIPVLSGARTIFDAARLLPFTDAVIVADQLLRGERTTPEQLHSVVLRLNEHAGGPSFARVAAFADRRSGSAGESFSRVWFAEMDLPAPDLQVEFHDADGQIGFTDFYWKTYRTIGEFDGRGKYDELKEGQESAPGVVYAEKRREDRLRVDNEVVRFGSSDVRSRPRQLLKRFHNAFALGQRRGPWTTTWIMPPPPNGTPRWR
ncbi:MAG: type IV toxin-antitoxin system AbiEi family antitoxin domain-containing protein [Actinomycetia bacterium]|nr:type IV toxin-antitoxin system AbiEi family antitoxin domain-containing protein [Actinomycetes bacterium]